VSDGGVTIVRKGATVGAPDTALAPSLRERR
jgi:hypothetical protein